MEYIENLLCFEDYCKLRKIEKSTHEENPVEEIQSVDGKEET